MNRDERIRALIAGTASAETPYTDADVPWLTTLADGKFTALEAAADLARGSTDEEFLADAPESIKALVAKAAAADETVRAAKEETEAIRAAAAVPLSEEAYLKQAPESIRTLVTEKKAADAELKTRLVKALKENQSEFTDAELDKMSVKELGRFAKALRVDEPAYVDFSGMGAPRAASAGDEVYSNPPDGYALAIAARAKTVQ